MIKEITSKEHRLIKHIAALKEKKYREESREFLVEGAMNVLWALHSDYEVKEIVLSSDFEMPPALSDATANHSLVKVPPHLFAKMADTKTPQGILCSCAMPPQPDLPNEGRFLFCDRVRDPGNLGSIIRSADALGFDGIFLSEESVDPFNPKLVRSTMGSLFHIRLFRDVTLSDLVQLKKKGFALCVSALTEKSISSRNWKPGKSLILVMGNEAAGASKEVLSLADSVIKIPMLGSAESFNVAAAAAILMYEAGGKSCE